MNQKFFLKKFYDLIGEKFDTVATIDHPYSSPPIRLLDGHYQLKKLNNQGKKVLICIWDVNIPDINRHRYELSFDTGILSCRDKDFFIFKENTIYPLQRPKLINFFELDKRIKFILNELNDFSKELKNIRNKIFLENLRKLAEIYIKTIKNSENGTIFYQNILREIYELIGFFDLSIFIAESFKPYFGGDIIQKWIPYCIKETKKEQFGFLNLLNLGLFKKPYFRTPFLNDGDELSDIKYINKNIDQILEMFENKNLIPSYEIFFWTLFLAGIDHFGNDYGFFNKLNDYFLKIKLNMNNKIQLTEHNKDCVNIIQFGKDRSFNCILNNGRYFIKKNNPIKNSRISSFTALYCHMGDDLGIVVKNIFENKNAFTEIIKMGNIYEK